jgi:hypothetical protein
MFLDSAKIEAGSNKLCNPRHHLDNKKYIVFLIVNGISTVILLEKQKLSSIKTT